VEKPKELVVEKAKELVVEKPKELVVERAKCGSVAMCVECERSGMVIKAKGLCGSCYKRDRAARALKEAVGKATPERVQQLETWLEGARAGQREAALSLQAAQLEAEQERVAWRDLVVDLDEMVDADTVADLSGEELRLVLRHWLAERGERRLAAASLLEADAAQALEALSITTEVMQEASDAEVRAAKELAELKEDLGLAQDFLRLVGAEMDGQDRSRDTRYLAHLMDGALAALAGVR